MDEPEELNEEIDEAQEEVESIASDDDAEDLEEGLILDEETHFTITGALFARGLRHVFNVD